jgi:hypothetical protein
MRPLLLNLLSKPTIEKTRCTRSATGIAVRKVS